MQEALFDFDEPRPKINTWVYVIGRIDTQIVKIGKAADVEARRKALQTSSPHKLVARWATAGGLQLERWLHDRFKPFRMEGEWFDFGELDAVAEIRRAVEESGTPVRELNLEPLPDIYGLRVMLGPRWNYRHPRPDDPDYNNPLFQVQPCGCRYLTPTELVAGGDDPAEAGFVFIMTEQFRSESGLWQTLCSLHGN